MELLAIVVYFMGGLYPISAVVCKFVKMVTAKARPGRPFESSRNDPSLKNSAFESPYQGTSGVLLTFCGDSLVGLGAEIAQLRLVKNPTYTRRNSTRVKSHSEPFSSKCEV